MKRMITLLLVLVMMLGLCACGKTDGGAADTKPAAKGDATGLKVGYSRIDITPSGDQQLPLAGYGNTERRLSTGFQVPLFTTCVAYSDGEDTVLIFQNDLAGAKPDLVATVRAKIKDKLAIPETNIMIAGTHTHSAPDLGNSKVAGVAKYKQDVINWMVECAEEAVADMKPVTQMTSGECFPENLNFVRHYTTESGIVKGDNFGDLLDSPITGHTHDVDNQLQVVRIDRKGGDSVVLVNWQSHPHRGGGGSNTNITSDIVGVMRMYVEEKLEGVQFAYYTGASGNVNPSSRIAKENITANYWEQGDALGSHAVKVLKSGEMKVLNGTNVQVLPNTFTGEVDHSGDSLVNAARLVQDEWTTNNNFRAACELANSYGINSPYHAGGIISKAGLGKTYDVEMYAISIGELAFVTAPYEMFDENGKYIKDNSPFETTFVITCCNNGVGYIPSIEGYNNNCYGANTGKFVPGTGETLAEEYVKLLDTIYQTK